MLRVFRLTIDGNDQARKRPGLRAPPRPEVCGTDEAVRPTPMPNGEDAGCIAGMKLISSDCDPRRDSGGSWLPCIPRGERRDADPMVPPAAKHGGSNGKNYEIG